MSPSTFKAFSGELSGYQIEDIECAVYKLMHQKREAGETAFPDFATIEDEVLQAKNARLKLEREASAWEQQLEAERHRREHPEQYFSVAEMIHNFIVAKKKAMQESFEGSRTLRALFGRKKKLLLTNGEVLEKPKIPNLREWSEADYTALIEAVRKRPELSVFSLDELRHARGE